MIQHRRLHPAIGDANKDLDRLPAARAVQHRVGGRLVERHDDIVGDLLRHPAQVGPCGSPESGKPRREGGMDNSTAQPLPVDSRYTGDRVCTNVRKL
jgi:hypothetical protein